VKLRELQCVFPDVTVRSLLEKTIDRLHLIHCPQTEVDEAIAALQE